MEIGHDNRQESPSILLNRLERQEQTQPKSSLHPSSEEALETDKTALPSQRTQRPERVMSSKEGMRVIHKEATTQALLLSSLSCSRARRGEGRGL